MIPDRYTINVQYQTNLVFAIVYEWDVTGETQPRRRMSMNMHESAERASQAAELHHVREKGFGNDVRYYIVPMALLDPRTCPPELFPTLPPEAANVTRMADLKFGRS